MERDTLHHRIRPAQIDDVGAIAQIEVETWRTTYAGMLPDRMLIGMSERRQKSSWAGLVRYRPGDVIVAELDGTGVVGFGNCGAQRDPSLPYTGEVFTLYVTPDAQNCGIGRRLIGALFERLLENGRSSALIWVIAANPSRYFYEHVGGKLILTRRIRIAGEPVEAVAYAWPDLVATVKG
ncbi:MAG: GNAT family N-acetyltransferase [Stellaceae bacterium]